MDEELDIFLARIWHECDHCVRVFRAVSGDAQLNPRACRNSKAQSFANIFLQSIGRIAFCQLRILDLFSMLRTRLLYSHGGPLS